MKLIRHGTLFVLLATMGVGAWLAITGVQGRGSVAVFAAAVALLGLALRELVGFINHAVGDTDYFEMRDDTPLDRAVVGSVGRMRSPAESTDEREDAVRIVQM